MKKWVKGIMGLAAAGGTIAGLVYYDIFRIHFERSFNYYEEMG